MAVRKDAHIVARCSPEKLQRIKDFVEARNMTLAEFINKLVDDALNEKPQDRDFDNLLQRVAAIEAQLQEQSRQVA